jgi:hypothetical protein
MSFLSCETKTQKNAHIKDYKSMWFTMVSANMYSTTEDVEWTKNV